MLSSETMCTSMFLLTTEGKEATVVVVSMIVESQLRKQVIDAFLNIPTLSPFHPTTKFNSLDRKTLKRSFTVYDKNAFHN